MERAFNDDAIAQNRVYRFISSKGIKTVVETGTLSGVTSRELAKIVERVISIEISEEYYNTAKSNLSGLTNVELYHSNSSQWLADNLKNRDLGTTLFFLDAHWYNYWPIRDEIKAIAESGKHSDCVIMIHDFYIPGNPHLGFDSYHGQHLNYDYIKDMLALVWPNGYTVEYNNQATGASRGIGYFYAK